MIIRCAAAALLLVPLSIQQQRDPEEYAAFLEGAERVARMQVPRVVDALGLAPGQRVVDLGSGSGLFTRPLAQRVAPGGLAYAVDIDPALLRIVERKAKEAGIANLRTVLADAGDPRLPEPVDLVLICDTLHHISDQGPYLARLVQSLKPTGRVAIIDFSTRWPSGHESMVYTRADLDRWTSGAGLELAASHDWLENSFFHIYARQAGARR